ncbi:WbqC family protein [uncultured Rikenella sp.]|uniref:WbqC family protein n=1 Tax=uncultured Rikenella sp. TaxID=368003 RepID=UPI0025F8D0ED|nr:WbqC family protein [uncultured Rikenella sp.]
MLITIAYLGNIQYFGKLVRGARIEACENFQKQTYRNRAEVMTAAGVQTLTVPVVWDHRAKMPIREVRIDYTLPWQHEHWRTLRAAYAAAPYFDHYAEKLAPFFDPRIYRPERLFDLNSDLTRLLLHLFGLPEHLTFTDEYTAPTPLDTAAEAGDFRDILSHKPRLRRPDPTFAAPEYYQVFADRIPFAPNLSAIDLLFCEGPQTGQIIQESIKP